ncbi:VQ motif-containing protein [Striga asiatica]|uniref:VQ motif-containing protein n=1 Tax=Striga asiatica TaxID=4170 RepID=A0A5A7R8V7_STRAF|nr:VQ motif-containing protein [Striga asiatica]
MEIASSIPLERSKISSPATSPSAGGGFPPPHPIPTPPPTPSPAASRSHESSIPHPTTFVQATASNFKQVVQMLTGSSGTAVVSAGGGGGGGGIPPIKSTSQKKQGFKLYERRNSLKSGLMINTLLPARFSGRKTEILSPSLLDFPSLALLSPPTPLNGDSLGRSAAAPSPTSEEERAIAEKKFYFHPSPRTKSGEPQLLPLFPVTSPRVSGSEN